MAAKSQRKLFAEKLDGRVVSYVELFVLQQSHHKDPTAYIADVFTEVDYRRKGYASKLLGDAINYAKRKGCYKVFLVCKPELEEWYKNSGLEKTGIQIQMMLRSLET